MGATDNARQARLNQAVERMADYTLRRTDVNDAVRRAQVLRRNDIIDARLGDPNVFGLSPFPRFAIHVERAMRDPKAWRYTESQGLPELREVLAVGNVEFGRNGYEISPDNVFIGPGISGVARSLFTVLIRQGDEVAIPEWSYIIYFAEAELSQAKVRNIKLMESGQVDIGHLRDSINRDTKAVFITTVGNPLGVAVSPERFSSIMRVINDKEMEFNHPIWLVADTIYENFRSGSEPIDPIRRSMAEGRLGPTVEFYSISKTIAAPGARLGWMKIARGTEFKEETDAFLENLARLYQPGLGGAPVVFQMALARAYQEVIDSPRRRKEFDAFRDMMKTQAIGRMRRFIEALSSIDGIVFPQCYYNRQGVDPGTMHSFYVLFGIDKELRPRSELSQARGLADFLIENPGSPIVFTTPGDSFLASGLRGKEQEFMRAVALSERTAEMAESVERFVKSKK